MHDEISFLSGISGPKAVTSSEDESYGPTVPGTSTNITAERATHKPAIGPILPSHLQDKHHDESEDSDSDQQAAGPALPPHLTQKSKAHTSSHSKGKQKSKKVYGPVIPGHEDIRNEYSDEDEDDSGLVGPSVSMQSKGQEGSALEDFESRAQKMRDRLAGKVSVLKTNHIKTRGAT